MAECAACGVEIGQDRILCESCAPAYGTPRQAGADGPADAPPARTSTRWPMVAAMAVAFLLTLVALVVVARSTIAASPDTRRLEVAANAVEASFTGDTELMKSSATPEIRALLAGTVNTPRSDRTLTRSWDGAGPVLTLESGTTDSPASAFRLRGDGDGVVLLDETDAPALRFVFSGEGGETIVSDVQENAGGPTSPVWKSIAKKAP